MSESINLNPIEQLNNMNKENDVSGFYEYKGKKIFVLDVFDCHGEETIARIDKATPIVRAEPEKSVRLLTDLRGLVYSSESLTAAKNYAKGNEAVTIKSAMLGISGMKKIAFNTLIRFSGRKNIMNFDRPEDALEWLAE